jgi:[acyl-carrier-protein] S-malonyltransferase
VKAIVLCPGQGAQKVGMGQDLADTFSAARAVFETADAACGAPLSVLMWQGPEADLTLTRNAQPAILAHALAVWAIVRVRITPVAAAGHSLGEYAAYAVAGALTTEAAVRLVRRRGELMHEAGTARPGAMAAVLGLAGDTVEQVCAAASDGASVVVAANLNAPDQTVISGDPAAVERAGEQLKAAGAKRVLALKVSGAFHSPLMAPARTGLEATLATATLADPSVPVIANASAEPVTRAAEARRLLGEQLTSPVRWVDSMRRLVADYPGVPFIEIGPGAVLAGLLKKIAPEATCLSLGTARDVTTFMEQAA